MHTFAYNCNMLFYMQNVMNYFARNYTAVLKLASIQLKQWENSLFIARCLIVEIMLQIISLSFVMQLILPISTHVRFYSNKSHLTQICMDKTKVILIKRFKS